MGRVEVVIKRVVLAMFVAAAVVCGGSKHPQGAPNAPTIEAIAPDASQTDAGRPDPLRWPAMVGYPPSEASPQSGCPSRGAIALNRPNAPQGTTVTAEDVARGYRFVAEATEDVSYTMPEDGMEVGNWGKRGTFGEWLRYELGWAFPLGSNDAAYSAFAVFNDAKIRPTPRDRSHEICAVGVPMLAMQGASRFWVYDGSGGETTLTWENFFLNADTNAPVNAQIVLYENGDFVTRSNEVARYYARIDPHDWDGDGLANEIDAEPYTNGGDCFGTGEGWWTANAVAVAATNANPNAYYWLEFAATADRTRVAVTCDGASDLGDMVVIARTNQVCRVPLLIGAAYAVRASAPLKGIVTSDENANITFNDKIQVGAARSVSEPYRGDWGQSHPSSDFASQSSSLRSSGDTVPLRSLYQSDPTSATQKNAAAPRRAPVAWGRASADFDVCSPLEFAVENYDDGRYGLAVSPTDPGVALLGVTGGCCTATVTNGLAFAWMCSGLCGCDEGGHTLYAEFLWEGYHFSLPLGNYPCGCEGHADDSAPSDLNGRSVGLRLLDADGGVIAWKDPILVGESVIVEATVDGESLTAGEFIGLVGGRLRLRAYTVDADGSHTMAERAVPVGAGNVAEAGSNVFRVAVSAAWLEANRLASNTEDGRLSKTSIDMSEATSGDSRRTDSDSFDAGVAGFLHGRARGMNNGDESAAIPEGAFNLRTVRAAGTACLVATMGGAMSARSQIQQQADVVYYSGHGDHLSSKLNGIVAAEDVTGLWHDVDTLVIAGCSVLDVGDRAGNYNFSEEQHHASPGVKWLAASGASTLLGYAYYAPTDAQGGERIVQDWCSLRMGLDDAEAWMQANDNPSGRNACSIRRIDDTHIEYRYRVKWFNAIWLDRCETITMGDEQ